MVTESGVVKVLDFGLAKLTEISGNSEEESTRTLRPSTEEGTILGTAAYMSPEQAEGKKVDQRSDVFSFGSLIYEMVTGQRAFHGDTKMSTLAAILNSDPKPVSDIVPGIPPEIQKLVRKCLRKDPSRRYQHMDDLNLALEELKEESDSGTLQGLAKDGLPSRSRKRLVIGAAVLLFTAAGLATWLVWRSRTSRPSEQGREAPQAVLTPVPLTTYAGSEYSPTFSPDGNQVAFSWDGPKQDNDDIYVKLIGPGEPLRITTDPAADSSPAWSPDGKWIAFERLHGQDAELLVVPALGGPERKLSDTLIDLQLKQATEACRDRSCHLISTDFHRGKAGEVTL